MQGQVYGLALVIAAAIVRHVGCLNNGLAATPPMGWMAWERFRCITDCDVDPDNCVSERLIMDMADRMASDGYRDVGYQYVSIDDCWQAKQRNATNGRLEPDSKRFPSGMRALADYVHKKGLKLGIYSDVGTYTCGGYPGSYDQFELDAQTFADWQVDMLKLDGCYANETYYNYSYPAMSKALNMTGRPILYSCSWPAYVSKPDYRQLASICNLWRNFDDIEDSWDSVYSIIQFYTADTLNFSAVAGPGSFNDPDQLIIGDFGLSLTQQKTQMALWAIFAAPLIMSTDLRTIDKKSRDILLNKNVIAVSQDSLGAQGHLVYQYSGMLAYNRKLANGGAAIAMLHPGDYGTPEVFKATARNLGLSGTTSYVCYETFEQVYVGTFAANDTISISVDPSGGSFLMTCHPSP